MNLPKDTGRFTISNANAGLFPPIGYLSIEETSDGGGDDYGLYWEIGKEDNFPIVCASRHEESLLVPELKDFPSFIDWFEETGGQERPTMNLNDGDFFISLLNKGKVLTKNGKNDEAIEKLEKSVSLFGEYSDTWYWLAENYYKIEKKDKADKAIINAIASNFFFGVPSKKTVDKFNALEPSGELREHPLVKRRTNLISGGDFATPLSMNYDLLLEIIAELKEVNDFRTAMIMKQNYGLLMSFETADIIQRYDFDATAWFESFRDELFSIYPKRNVDHGLDK